MQLVAALGLDLVLGDPRRLPHVARGVGWLARVGAARIVPWTGRSILGGAILWAWIQAVVLGAFALALVLADRCGWTAIAWALEVFVVYQAVAARDLWTHVLRVERPLIDGDLPQARRALAMIVGRDTVDLDRNEIARATLESLGESTSDGWVAPLFWTVVAGPAGALVYRVSNTLDSILGHRDPAHERLGKVSARADDALGWVPARLTALVSAAGRGFARARRISIEARLHASPNAGWPEAALAHALGVRLGGTNRYGGEEVRGPVFNPEARPAGPADLARGRLWFACVAGASAVLAMAAVLMREVPAG